MYRKYPNVIYNGITYYSETSKIDRFSIVLSIYFPNQSALLPSDSITLRPAKIHHFIQHSIDLNNNAYDHTLACVSWLKEHHNKDYYGKPCEIWWKDLYQEDSFDFIPLQFLSCHCAHTDIKFEDQTVLFVCPINNIKF